MEDEIWDKVTYKTRHEQLKELQEKYKDVLFGSLVVLETANQMFKGSKPLLGKELDLLNECLSKNSKSVPTLKGRL